MDYAGSGGTKTKLLSAVQSAPNVRLWANWALTATGRSWAVLRRSITADADKFW